ncbi:MAG: glycine cleavage system protein H [Nitrososphaerales archaeon]
MVKLLEKFEFKEGLYYSKDHMWVKLENGKVRVGVTDVAQRSAGPITFIRLLPKGKLVVKGKPLGTIETGKWVGPLISPVSGTLVEVNENLKSQPKLLNEDPYGAGWIAVIQPSNFEEDKKALISDLKELEEFIKSELQRLKLT